jgi:hypothetical protein
MVGESYPVLARLKFFYNYADNGLICLVIVDPGKVLVQIK